MLLWVQSSHLTPPFFLLDNGWIYWIPNVWCTVLYVYCRVFVVVVYCRVFVVVYSWTGQPSPWWPYPLLEFHFSSGPVAHQDTARKKQKETNFTVINLQNHWILFIKNIIILYVLYKPNKNVKLCTPVVRFCLKYNNTKCPKVYC